MKDQLQIAGKLLLTSAKQLGIAFALTMILSTAVVPAIRVVYTYWHFLWTL